MSGTETLALCRVSLLPKSRSTEAQSEKLTCETSLSLNVVLLFTSCVTLSFFLNKPGLHFSHYEIEAKSVLSS